ncbi:HesA/MoeB/ThiF family protein [Campylobacter sputorum]|uniref:HesA/MoeB/ThiF family protein n=1 Tax=Campylobacter sputorum TaxID=206 RepID=UPI001E56C1B3|nr:ThiF family adenylyltransferase [Campylobacter sputorum]
MNEYFLRQIALWGEDTQNSLKDKKIAIIGSGGLGSSLGYALSSSGIGEISIVDFDTVSLHNIHRQILFGMEDIGKYKAEVFKEKLEKRYDGVKINVYLQDFETWSKKGLKFDLILDATDNMPTRALIDDFAKNTNTPWIYSSVEWFNGQLCFMHNAKLDFVKINDRLPGGIAAPIVMFMASFEANLAIRYLAGLEVKKDMLYYLDMSSGELNISKFSVR